VISQVLFAVLIGAALRDQPTEYAKRVPHRAPRLVLGSSRAPTEGAARRGRRRKRGRDGN
jgi:hypothetical protein